jgi:putative hydrolase of the HAD superfamily
LIKHISFDLWLTLIKSHPDFKQRRAEFISREYNPLGYSVNTIMDVVQRTDKVCDRLNEITGRKVSTELMYRRILVDLFNDFASINEGLLLSIKLEVNRLFMNYPPPLLNESILPMLQYLKNEGYSLNISSNTGYIEGSTMEATLKNIGIWEYFNFCIFSDQIGLSKPSVDFYDKVLERSGCKKEEILHVGDNYKADFEGALKYGFKALHINNQQYTVNDITRHLQKND